MGLNRKNYRKNGNVSLYNYILPYAYSLPEPYSDNVPEYSTLLIGLELAKNVRLKYLEMLFKLIINLGKYKVHDEKLA